MADVKPSTSINWKAEAVAFGRAMLIAAAVFLAARFGIQLDPQVFVVNTADGRPVMASKLTDCPCPDCPDCDKCPGPKCPTTKK